MLPVWMYRECESLRRVEHRLAGADANPYLVVAWMLAGIHRGLSRGAEPPPCAVV